MVVIEDFYNWLLFGCIASLAISGTALVVVKCVEVINSTLRKILRY